MMTSAGHQVRWSSSGSHSFSTNAPHPIRMQRCCCCSASRCLWVKMLFPLICFPRMRQRDLVASSAQQLPTSSFLGEAIAWLQLPQCTVSCGGNNTIAKAKVVASSPDGRWAYCTSLTLCMVSWSAAMITLPEPRCNLTRLLTSLRVKTPRERLHRMKRPAQQ